MIEESFYQDPVPRETRERWQASMEMFYAELLDACRRIHPGLEKASIAPPGGSVLDPWED